MSRSSRSIDVLLSEYKDLNKLTDRLSNTEVTSILFGLFGEVGSVMSTAKKLDREKEAFSSYSDDAREELGDTLWYIFALCRRLKVHATDIFSEFIDDELMEIPASNSDESTSATSDSDKSNSVLQSSLLRLGEHSAHLLGVNKDTDKKTAENLLRKFIQEYVETIKNSQVSFIDIIEENMAKIRSRFVPLPFEDLNTFDDESDETEQLPHKFEIEITQDKSGRVDLRWNGVVIGNSLSDNIEESDYYRFHDVFHLAYAAILHWSPTFRALIKHKRKNTGNLDETQDSGRPRLIEEGLSAYIFSYSKDLNFFEGHEDVSFNLLKTIQNFVRGYEVDKCPLYLWEKAILQGFEVFRQVRDNGGGIVIGNRDTRTLCYKLLEKQP